MKMYFEMIEDLTEEERLTRQPLQIRLELRDEAKAPGLLKLFSTHFAGRRYHAQIHYCYHDEGKPCRVKLLRKVG